MNTEKLGPDDPGKVWSKVFTLIKKVTGDVDVAGKGTLQEQITKHETLTFEEASTRENISSGESHSIVMGKIRKWLTDLAAAAFAQMVTSYPDLMATTVSGYLADALAVKEGFEEINSNLDNLFKPSISVINKAVELTAYADHRETVFTATEDCYVDIDVNVSGNLRYFYIDTPSHRVSDGSGDGYTITHLTDAVRLSAGNVIVVNMQSVSTTTIYLNVVLKVVSLV